MVSPTIFSLLTMRMRHGLTDSTAGMNMELKFCICAWSTAIYKYNRRMMNQADTESVASDVLRFSADFKQVELLIKQTALNVVQLMCSLARCPSLTSLSVLLT